MTPLKSPIRQSVLKPDDPTTAASCIRIVAGMLLIAGVAFLSYWPAIQGGFLLDDDLLVTDNSLVKAPDGLYRMWFTREPVDYWPVTNSAFWLQWRQWGMNPTGYHVTNLLLHVGSCLLVWLLLKRLAIPGGCLAALLFAVHPMNVESVAWIAELKNVLSMLFFLLSLVWYVNALSCAPQGAANLRSRKWEEEREHQPIWNRWYWLSLLAFTLAMLSKGSVAILPLLLLLIVWWQGGRITLRDIWPTVPFFIVAAGLTWVNIWFQQRDWGETIRQITPIQRLLGAGAVIWFYLYKAILPIHLAFVYPQWKIDAANVLWWLPLLAAEAVTAWLLYTCWSSPQKNWARHLLFAWIAFVVALLPVLGFVDIGFMKLSLVADHFAYVALVAVVALAAAGWAVWRRQMAQVGRNAMMVPAIAVVVAGGFLTWQRSHSYQSAMGFYQGIVAENPESWMAQTNLGVELSKVGNSSAAIERYKTSLSINPDNAETYNCLGVELVKQGQLEKGIQFYRTALNFEHNFPEIRFNLAKALSQLGRTQDAIKEYEVVIRLRPTYPDALNNLGNELNRAGQLTEAIDYYRRAIRLDPDNAATHYNLATALQNSNHPAEAVEQYQAALRLDPANADAAANLASAYADLGRAAEAVTTAQKALEMARSEDKKELSEQIDAWLTKYRVEHPEAASH